MILELLKNKPYCLFLLASILFLIVTFTVDKNETLDINIHDTYYIILFKDVSILLSLLFFALVIIYVVLDFFRIQLFSIFSSVHVYGSLISVLLIFYYFYKIQTEKDFQIFNTIDYNFRLFFSMLLFLFLQVILIINLVASIIKKLSNLTPQ